ncbi:MAG: VOC family protein [Thermoflexales bacterium]|nr:VOC family protein [Thermoflexales bacterium]
MNNNTSAWARNIAAITLFVEDLAAARHFYGALLGLTQVFEDADSVVFKVGGTLINLLIARAAPELVAPASVGVNGHGARAVYTLPVDDVDALCETLTRRGLRLLNGPMTRPWGPRTASFQDPSGHIWEIAS